MRLHRKIHPVLAAQRHRSILRLLNERGRLTLREIESRLGISAATVRRDARHLAATGLVQRVHGGLLPPDFSLSEPAFPRKAEKAASAKARLAAAAAALLPETGTIFIDAGTTCLEVGRVALDRSGLKIVTNSIPLLALAPDGRAALTAIGGEVRAPSLALTGALSLQWLEQLRFDVAVIGASGLEADHGAFTTEIAESGLKAEALRRSRLRILVAHAEKWGRPAAFRYAPWSAFHHFITDKVLSRDERATLSKAGVKYHHVSSK